MLALAACGSPAAVADAPSPDAPGASDAFALVNGRARALDVRLDSQHLPMPGDQPFVNLAATLRQPDGTWAPVTVAADGSFSFAMPDARSYRLRLAADGGLAVELALGSPSLDYIGRYAFRYDRTPVPAGTILNVTLPGAPAAGMAVIETTGIWGNVGRPAAAGNGSFTLDWTAMPGLLDASANDRAYAVIIDAAGTAPQYNTITSACSADITMAAGANALTCSLAPQPLDHCMHVRAHFASESARVAAAVPPSLSYPNQVWSWNIDAAPDPMLGPIALMSIGGTGYATPPAVDVDRDQTLYGLPAPGHSPVLQVSMQRYRTATAPGATAGVTLSIVTQHFVSAAPDCSTPTEAQGTVAIAGTPALAGTPLAADNQKVSIDRSSDVGVSWPIAADGRADYWVVVIDQVTTIGAATVLVPVQVWYATDTQIAVDPSLLVANKLYIVEVVAVQGFADSESGDFRTLSFPQTVYATSVQWSAMFEVTN